MQNGDADVLVVDDDASVCWALARVLKGCGATPITANTAFEALELARAHRFRLVFVDAKLPDLEGADLARRLRDADPTLPIVLVSAYYYRDDADVHQAIAAGVVSAFISKPFWHDEVRGMVRQALASATAA